MIKRKKFIIISIGLCALAVIGLAIYISYDLEYYFFRHQSDQGNWQHPTANVMLFCTFILVEGIVLSLILTAPLPTRLWVRGIIGSIVLIPWVYYSTLFVLHMPGYILIHHLWAWVITFITAVVSLISAIAHAKSTLRNRTKYKEEAA